jgi:GTP-binding protein EngB required for normal cell division
MKNPIQFITAIRDFFDRYAKVALQRTEKPQDLAGFEKQAEVLKSQVGQLNTPFRVAVLGQARVGKSTLINALVADTASVVPSGGGDGPLTANALRVSYGCEKRFTVRYHPRRKINEMLFGLERKLERQSGLRAAALEAASLQPEDEGELKWASDLELTPSESKESESEELSRQVRLITAGSQSVDRPLAYLVDALLHVLGKAPKHGTTFLDEDLPRLDRVKIAVESGTAKKTKEFANLPPAQFNTELRLHASGHLAPLIYEMQIEWPSALLQNQVEVVDLPGLGVHNDPFESVTTRYLRSEAQAVMLVTDSGGVRKNEASLLRDFLNRLLHAGDNPDADPVTLIMAVVQIDNIAVERWKNDREENGGNALKNRAQHFEDLVTSIRQNMVKQLSDLLTEIWQSSDESLQRDKALVIERLIKRVKIFPLSAPQYRDILSEDPESPPFLKSAESTQVPALREALAELSRQYRKENETRLGEAAGRFFGQLRARLMLAHAQLSSDTRVLEERQSMEDQLDDFLGPKQREFDTRRGAFRNHLRETVPEQIQSRVLQASEVSRKEINAYLRTLRGYHWATLRASVRRNGVFDGARRIQLPHDFALRFEEPIAQIWSNHILRSLRTDTGQFADDQATLLRAILSWAKESGIKVTTKLLEALIGEVEEQRKQLNAVGKDAIEELRAAVNKELLTKIEEPIRRRCEVFIKKGDDVGPGVMQRMLGMFEELASDVVESARAPATKLLITRFREVESEITQELHQHANPIAEAKDALLQKLDRQLAREGTKAAEALHLVTQALAAIPRELEDGIAATTEAS